MTKDAIIQAAKLFFGEVKYEGESFVEIEYRLVKNRIACENILNILKVEFLSGSFSDIGNKYKTHRIFFKMEKNSQFDDFDISTHNERLNRIKELSKKKYLDDGPMALFYCIKAAQEKEFHTIVEFAIRELEKLYNLKL